MNEGKRGDRGEKGKGGREGERKEGRERVCEREREGKERGRGEGGQREGGRKREGRDLAIIAGNGKGLYQAYRKKYKNVFSERRMGVVIGEDWYRMSTRGK